jgi:prepilin-type processing-associated H-X9-DG protein
MRNRWRKSNQRIGFSLVELLIVVGAIGVLIGLMLPAVQQVRGTAARSLCLDNLRQIGLALHHYHDTNGRLPPRKAQQDLSRSHEPDTLLTWMVLLLPFLDQDSLWATSERACRLDPRPFHDPPHVGNTKVLPVYICPADGRLRTPLTTAAGNHAAFTSYIGIAGSPIGGTTIRDGTSLVRVNAPGVLGNAPGIRFTQVRDGTSQTIMVGERPPPGSLQAGRWYSGKFGIEPYSGPDESMTIPPAGYIDDPACSVVGAGFGPGQLGNPCDRFQLWSLHLSGANCLFADGSARFMRHAAAPIMPALATRSGGEVVDIP